VKTLFSSFIVGIICLLVCVIAIERATAQALLPPGTWQELAELTASDGPQAFASVAIDGNTVVVGAPGETISGNGNQGAAYIFVKPTGGWSSMTQVAKLTASDGNPNVLRRLSGD
jgi:hypothetical protein